MKRIIKGNVIFALLQCVCFMIVLIGFVGESCCAILDSAAFDPRSVSVKAKGGGIPVGSIISWPVTSNPSDMEYWLECNGQTISQHEYPDLYAIIGPNVPDYRGLFLRGHGGASAGLGVRQSDAMRPLSFTFNRAGSGDSFSGAGWSWNGGGSHFQHGAHWDWHGGTGYTFNLGWVMPTASEIRPVNTAVRYLIRALP